MADVDSLDVHGVRYAEIFTGIKQDLRLGGMGFKALIDFTSVDTMRASLERVISEKLDRESKVETMCYYKKRRRGAVLIRNQRDVILACCEYPLVTNIGKPAPDPYIKVGVLLYENSSPLLANSLQMKKAALNALDSRTRDSPGLGYGQTVAVSLGQWGKRPKILATGTSSGALVMRSVLKNPPRRKTSTDSQPVPHVRADNATTTPTFILDDQPPSKRVCLDSDVEWALALPGESGGTVEIRPIETTSHDEGEEKADRSSPEPFDTSPPEPPLKIKDEPLEPVEIKPRQEKTFEKRHASTTRPQTRRRKVRENTEKIEVNNDTSSMDEDDNGEDEGQGQIPLVICPKDKDSPNETEFKQMWDQIRKMESRLNYMDHSKTSSQNDEASGSSEDLSAKISNLEQRLYSIEKGKEESDAPLLYLGDRLSKVEKNVTKIMNAVDKLSKSLLMVQRKQVKTNTSVDVISTNLRELNESQNRTSEALEKMNVLLAKNLG